MTQIKGVSRASAISFRQLKLYESIGRLKSVRRASEDCNLSQPAVTQSLAKLEQLVGATLVERRASGSYLNDFGEMFYRRVERFFAQFEDALERLGIPGGTGAAKSVTTRILRSQVRALVSIVENGSFSQGAVALDLSQASLQRAARDLEGNLRRPLYFRTASGMAVSPEGIEFGRRMKLALQEIDWGIRELEAARGGEASPIIVGAMPLGGSVLLASVLERFMQAHPRADIAIRNESAVEMVRSLRGGDVDFVVGLIPAVPSDGLNSEALAHTPYSIVARRGHPLLRKGQIATDDLVEYDWLIGAAGSSRRACFDRLFEGRRGARAPIATSALSIIRQLLVQSDRLTLMTSYEIHNQEVGLVAIPYDPITPVPSIGMTTRADWLPTRLHEEFMQLIRDHVAEGLNVGELRKAS